MDKIDIYFVITIDVECDHQSDWNKADPVSFKSVTQTIPDTLEPLFKKYDAIPTYLLTVEVLENDEAVSSLKSLSGCEFGTHLHPEYVAPEKKYCKYGGTLSKEFSNNLDPSVEKEKIRGITKLFEEKIGYGPVVYRGGKFGFGDTTAESLAEIGYLVDTSVTPHISWRNINGPDFRNASEQPYFIKGIRRKLLEVPVSIMFLNMANKILNKPTWLRPSFDSGETMKRLADSFIKRYCGSKVVVLNMMFHSMEFCVGASPYSRNRGDVERLLNNLNAVLKYCKEMKVRFCGLSYLNKVIE